MEDVPDEGPERPLLESGEFEAEKVHAEVEGCGTGTERVVTRLFGASGVAALRMAADRGASPGGDSESGWRVLALVLGLVIAGLAATVLMWRVVGSGTKKA